MMMAKIFKVLVVNKIPPPIKRKFAACVLQSSLYIVPEIEKYGKNLGQDCISEY